MKNSNKIATSHVIEIIDQVFDNNGKKDIPNVQQICVKAGINRPRALKCLYEWWERYNGNDHRLLSLNKITYMIKNEDVNQLQNAVLHLQSLSKEIEIYSESLNQLSDKSFPLGNFILDSLREIENKLFAALAHVSQMNQAKKMIEEQLNEVLIDNARLEEESFETQKNASEKLIHMEETLDAKRREVTAAKHLVKALKKEKRRPTLKRIF